MTPIIGIKLPAINAQADGLSRVNEKEIMRPQFKQNLKWPVINAKYEKLNCKSSTYNTYHCCY